MKNNPAYKRFEAYADAAKLPASALDDLKAADLEKTIFPEGRPANDGTRHEAVLRCYQNVLAERADQAELDRAAQALRAAGLTVYQVVRQRDGFRVFTEAPQAPEVH